MLVVAAVLFLLSALSITLPSALAQTAHRKVVDDSNPAIFYTFGTSGGQAGKWLAVNSTNPSLVASQCRECTKLSDASQANGGTWHVGMGVVSISYTFSGTGIAAYFASTTSFDTSMSLSFFVDGQPYSKGGGSVAEAIGIATDSDDLLAFAVTGLVPQTHQLQIIQSDKSSTIILEYLVYDGAASSVVFKSPSTRILVRSEDEQVNPLRVPASHGAANSIHVDQTGAAIAGAFGGTLLVFIAVEVVFRTRRRKTVANVPLGTYSDTLEDQFKQPDPLTSSEERISRQNVEITADIQGHDSYEIQSRRSRRSSRFKSAVSTMVAALTPCQIASFTRIELRMASAVLKTADAQHHHGPGRKSWVTTQDQGCDLERGQGDLLAVKTFQRMSTQTISNANLAASMSTPPSLGTVDSVFSVVQPLSILPTAPLRLARLAGQSGPPSLPRFTFEHRQCRQSSTMDPDILQRQIQDLLWGPRPSSRGDCSRSPPPYISRPPSLGDAIASRRSQASSRIALREHIPLVPPVPQVPERAIRKL